MANGSSAQNPYVAAGSRVVMVVSSGPASQPPSGYATMPDVVGRSQGDALSALMDEGVQARVFNDYSTGYARGKVMGQMPLAGAGAPAGAEAVLIVSSGKHPEKSVTAVPLPDVVGLSESAALERLERVGLSPQVVRDHSTSVAPGVVFAQLPDRSSLAEKPARPAWWVWALVVAAIAAAGIAAYLFLAGAQVAVPSVTGEPQASATNAITAAGLVVGSITATETSDYPPGVVVAQSPAAGSEVREGSPVDLVVVAGPGLVEVPDVVNKSEVEATQELERAGFDVQTTKAPSSEVDKGFVSKQTPAAGTKAVKGSRVSITVSEGEQQTSVPLPNVIGLTRQDAEQTLAEAGMKIVVTENPSENVAQGVVVAQVPSAGDGVEKGTTVGLVVSSGPPPGPETVPVPNLVGGTLAEAQAALNDAGLGALPVPIDGTGKPANEVVYQSPADGAEVSPGSTVLVYYASGK